MGEPVGVGQFSVLHTAPHHNRSGEWKSNVQFHIPHPLGTIECLETSCILFNSNYPVLLYLESLVLDQQKVSTYTCHNYDRVSGARALCACGVGGGGLVLWCLAVGVTDGAPYVSDVCEVFELR